MRSCGVSYLLFQRDDVFVRGLSIVGSRRAGGERRRNIENGEIKDDEDCSLLSALIRRRFTHIISTACALLTVVDIGES